MDSDKSHTNGTLPSNWTTFSNLSRNQQLANSNGKAYAIGGNTVTNNSTNNDENDLNDENLDWNFTSQTENNNNNDTKTKDNKFNSNNNNNRTTQEASTMGGSGNIDEMKTNSESIDTLSNTDNNDSSSSNNNHNNNNNNNNTNTTNNNHSNHNNNDNDSIGNISNGHNINHINNGKDNNNNHSGGDSGRLQLLINSMPISLRSKLAKNSGFGNNVSNSLFNMNASSNAKKVLLITDKRFVSKPISTYLITTIRVAGFKVTKCDDIEQAPLNWKIINNDKNGNENNNNNNNKKNGESNQGKIANNSKNVTKKTETLKKRKNGKIENNNNDSKNEEFKFEDLDISPTLTDFDIIMIPTQIKDSIWQNTILGNNNNNNNEISEKAKELASFVENGGVLLLSHFRACEIINGITNNNLKWHETSVRIGKSKLNLPYNVINGVTERAKQQLSNVNDIRGILGVSHDNSIYKCDDFTTIGRYSYGNGIIGYIGHDFNAILAKDWNNILFLLMKKQLIYTNEYKNEMEMKFDFDIAAIKKLKFDDINNNDDENDTNTNTTNNNEDEEEDVEWSPFGSDNEDDNDNDNNNDENDVNNRDGFEIIPDNEDDISDQMEQDSADFPLTNLTAVKEEGNDDDDDDDNGDDEAT